MVRELNQISKEVDGIEVKMGGISEEVEGIEKVRRASVLVLVCACFRGDNTAFVELNTLQEPSMICSRDTPPVSSLTNKYHTAVYSLIELFYSSNLVRFSAALFQM